MSMRPHQYPIAVSPEFRQYLLQRFPALNDVAKSSRELREVPANDVTLHEADSKGVIAGANASHADDSGIIPSRLRAVPDRLRGTTTALHSRSSNRIVSDRVLQAIDRPVVYRRFMQVLLFSNFRDYEYETLDGGSGVILTRDAVAEIVGVHPKSRNFSAERWINEFSREVLPLTVRQHRYTAAKARVVVPQLDEELQQRLAEELERPDRGQRVWLVEGTPFSRRSREFRLRLHEQALRDQALATPPSHPGYELVQYLTRQPGRKLICYLNENWPAVEAAVEALPETTERQRATKLYSRARLRELQDVRRIFYTTTCKSVRVQTAGASIVQLPRAIRKIALGGATELDLKSCQLAIAARLWGIEEMQQFLQSGGDIWKELQQVGRVGPEAKPILKRTIYSCLFGMGKDKIRDQLRCGTEQDVGVGAAAERRIYKHDLVQMLLEARSRQLKIAKAKGGIWDAFGQKQTLLWEKVDHDGIADVAGNKWSGTLNTPSLLARQIQSHELKLMLSIMPILDPQPAPRYPPQITVLLWLHDGVTLHLGNITKRERQLRQLQTAVREAALQAGFATYLEVTELPRHTNQQQESHAA